MFQRQTFSPRLGLLRELEELLAAFCFNPRCHLYERGILPERRVLHRQRGEVSSVSMLSFGVQAFLSSMYVRFQLRLKLARRLHMIKLRSGRLVGVNTCMAWPLLLAMSMDDPLP